jgi:hypothetical protein
MLAGTLVDSLEYTLAGVLVGTFVDSLEYTLVGTFVDSLGYTFKFAALVGMFAVPLAVLFAGHARATWACLPRREASPFN